MILALVGYFTPPTISPKHGEKIHTGTLHAITPNSLDAVVTQKLHLTHLAEPAKRIPPAGNLEAHGGARLAA
jgi:hypothetical protein